MAKAQYASYILNGMMTQLARIEPGKNVEESHMRNRKLIAEWCYEQGKADNVIEWRTEQGKTYVVVNDFEKLRELFGRMLREIQRIKSEGDYEAGKALVEQYAVKVDPKLHREVLDRYEALHIEPYGGIRQSRIRTGGTRRPDRRREDRLPRQLRGADARILPRLLVPARPELMPDKTVQTGGTFFEGSARFAFRHFRSFPAARPDSRRRPSLAPLTRKHCTRNKENTVPHSDRISKRFVRRRNLRHRRTTALRTAARAPPATKSPATARPPASDERRSTET